MISDRSYLTMDKHLKISIKDRTRMLKDMTKMQCEAYAEGAYDTYMHGLANGLLMAEAIMENKDDVKLLEAFNTQNKLKSRAEAVLSRPEEPIEYDH